MGYREFHNRKITSYWIRAYQIFLSKKGDREKRYHRKHRQNKEKILSFNVRSLIREFNNPTMISDADFLSQMMSPEEMQQRHLEISLPEAQEEPAPNFPQRENVLFDENLPPLDRDDIIQNISDVWPELLDKIEPRRCTSAPATNQLSRTKSPVPETKRRTRSFNLDTENIERPPLFIRTATSRERVTLQPVEENQEIIEDPIKSIDDKIMDKVPTITQSTPIIIPQPRRRSLPRNVSKFVQPQELPSAATPDIEVEIPLSNIQQQPDQVPEIQGPEHPDQVPEIQGTEQPAPTQRRRQRRCQFRRIPRYRSLEPDEFEPRTDDEINKPKSLDDLASIQINSNLQQLLNTVASRLGEVFQGTTQPQESEPVLQPENVPRESLPPQARATSLAPRQKISIAMGDSVINAPRSRPQSLMPTDQFIPEPVLDSVDVEELVIGNIQPNLPIANNVSDNVPAILRDIQMIPQPPIIVPRELQSQLANDPSNTQPHSIPPVPEIPVNDFNSDQPQQEEQLPRLSRQDVTRSHSTTSSLATNTSELHVKAVDVDEKHKRIALVYLEISEIALLTPEVQFSKLLEGKNRFEIISTFAALLQLKTDQLLNVNIDLTTNQIETVYVV